MPPKNATATKKAAGHGILSSNTYYSADSQGDDSEQWGDIPADINIEHAFGNTLNLYDNYDDDPPHPRGERGRIDNDVRDVRDDDGHPPADDDSDNCTVEELCGAADWLLGEVADGGGDADDWEISPVSIQELLGRTHHLDQELVVATIHHYTSDEHRTNGRRLRRVNSKKAGNTLEEIFNEDGDEDLLPVAYIVMKTVQQALLDRSDFAMEWLFGSMPVETAELPNRKDTLALFQAREIPFSTRLQYQMWLNDVRYKMKFSVAPFPRRIQFMISAAMENQPLLYLGAMEISEWIWKNPGIEQKVLVKQICQREGNTLSEADVLSILKTLDGDYLISSNTKNQETYWYFTAINPQRRLSDARVLNVEKRFFNQTRSWSQWW